MATKAVKEASFKDTNAGKSGGPPKAIKEYGNPKDTKDSKGKK